MKVLILLLLFFKTISVTVEMTIDHNKVMEGYPLGFLSDCPGSNKEAKISRSSLRHLSFLLVGNGTFLTASRTAFNYFQMKQLAKVLDFKKKTVIYMPGYMDSSYVFPVSPMIGSLHKKMGHNSLLLEYLTFSAMVYPVAARFLRPVGRRVAEMLVALTELGLDPKKLEIVGISHGGQGVSFIGKSYRELTGVNISRITGLDPSGPCFRNLGPNERLDASDADFVDVIHTNIDGYGMAAQMGHVDFYINGGEFQPGDFIAVPCSSLCSHTRVFTLWIAASLNPNSFFGTRCESIQDARMKNCFGTPLVTNVMGPKTDKSKPGLYYVMTHNVFPYYLGTKGLSQDKEVFNIELTKYNKEDVMVL